MSKELYINNFSLITCWGGSLQENLDGFLNKNYAGMQCRDDLVYDKKLRFGTIDSQLLPEVPKEFLNIACNKIMLFCINQLKKEIDELIAKYGANRIAVIIGSSNTGIAEGQVAIEEYLANGNYPDWFNFHMLELGSPAKFVADYLGLSGINYTISTACSSSAKVFSTARRLIDLGVANVVLAGGVDSLCGYAANGFYALEALSEDYANPFSKNRNGITIGEAGALFVVSKKPSEIKILGIGETSDAYHMTSPHPNGDLAREAMQMAIADAQITAENIDFVSLHGTGTMLNDAMESRAVYKIFGDRPYCSSVKPLIGHTLGACGAVELALCCLLLSKLNPQQLIPPHPWDGEQDQELPPLKFADKALKSERLKYIISNSFAFGGSNASIVIGK